MLHEETEQLEAFKVWWAKYQKRVILGVSVVLLAGGGWKYWHFQRDLHLQQAALSYEEFQKSIARKEQDTATIQAKALMEKYGKTVYAESTALYMAKEAAAKNDWKEAKQHLEWVMNQGSTLAVKELAKIQLAKIVLQEKKPEEVFSLFSRKSNGPYEGIQDELKGDAYKMQGKIPEAKEAYQKASAAYKKAEISHPLIDMKLHELSE